MGADVITGSSERDTGVSGSEKAKWPQKQRTEAVEAAKLLSLKTKDVPTTCQPLGARDVAFVSRA